MHKHRISRKLTRKKKETFSAKRFQPELYLDKDLLIGVVPEFHEAMDQGRYIHELRSREMRQEFYPGPSLGAAVQKNTECTICGNLNCEHLMTPNVEVFADSEGTTRGNIEFFIEGVPILELKKNGDILVEGRLAENDKEVVDAMRLFLQNAQPTSFQDCPKCGCRLISRLSLHGRNAGG